MWETAVVVVTVGAALYFTGRSLNRSLRGNEKGGCSGGCSGCSCAQVPHDTTTTEEDT